MKFIPTPVQVYSNQMNTISDQLHRRRPKLDFWTIDQIKTMYALYNKGVKIKTIGDTIGRTETAVASKLYKVLHDQELIQYIVGSVRVPNPKSKTKRK